MTDRVGQQLGNYRLIRLLGQGGFADVYLAQHLHLNTQAAIKVLRDMQLTESNLEQFRTEAQTIANLIHPHIVRVLDFGVEENMPYLVMDYASHGTLREHHPKGTLLPLSTIVSYIKQVAAALQYAHDQKLIHRDVKPENMLLGRNHEVLLSDFGFVLIAQSSSSMSTQEMAGTVPYMAPEQPQGKPRLASDQYSLGIVVYEWLCGERPFQGSVLEIATQHMLAPPPSFSEKNAATPPKVEQVVLRALAKDFKQRFSTVQDFASALEQAYLSPQMPFIDTPTNQTFPLTSAVSSRNQVVEGPNRPIPQGFWPHSDNTIGLTTPSPGGTITSPGSLLQSSVDGSSPKQKRLTWSDSFWFLFGLLFVLITGSSLIAFNFVNRSNHAVELGLSLLFVLVAASMGLRIRGMIPRSILFLSGLAVLVSGLTFAMQTLADFTSFLLPTQLSPNLLLTSGLAAASIISLFWLARPFTMIDRIVVLIVFGVAVVCTFIQYHLSDINSFGNSDGDTKHTLLIIVLILLTMGTLLATHAQYGYQRKSKDL